MEYTCDVCGGTLREENGIVVCSHCGYPLYEIEESFFAPYREIYELIRNKKFSEAMEGCKALLPNYPQEARLYWAMLLCKFGVEYEKKGDATYPNCTILRNKTIYEDGYFKKALAYASEPLKNYIKVESIRLENARRLLAKNYAEDEIFLHDFDLLDDVVYESDYSVRGNRSNLIIGLSVLGFVAITAGIIGLIFSAFGKQEIEYDPVLTVVDSNLKEYYSGQSVSAIQKDILVIYRDSHGKETRVGDYTLEGEIKVGDNEVVITYESLSQTITVKGIGIDCTEGLSYTTIGSSVKVVGYSGTETDISIPYYYGGRQVTAIGENAFLGSAITSIFLPETLVTIGESAFEGSALTSIVIPSSVTEVGYNTFRSCKSLKTAKIGCATLSSGMFASCTSLTEIYFNETIEEIPNSCFSSCSSLRSITLPQALKVIGPNAFGSCVSLNSVYFPIGLQTISELAFSYIGEVGLPHFDGDWMSVEKKDRWCENTTFGPIIPW